MDDKVNELLETPVDRAEFMRRAAGMGLAAGVGMMALSSLNIKLAFAQDQGKDELFIMTEDLKKAMNKPDVKWGMLIDLRRCTGCSACTVGCIAEQKSPPGVMYRPVYHEESGTYPNVNRRFTPRPCNQCENPPCFDACPKKGKATWKSTSGVGNGIVMINYDECIGCGRCVDACPYKVRTLDAGAFYTEGTPAVQAYEQLPTYEYGKEWPREKKQIPVGKARKCHFCFHRLNAGMLPACVNTCVCRANYFGDMGDNNSLISRMMQQNKNQIKVLKSVDGDPGAGFGGERHKGAVKIGYPGKTPVFADSADTKPRVMFILP